MKALTVYEALSFERGIDPKKSLGIGVMSKFEEVFNENYRSWTRIPEMANALYNSGVIKRKGEALRIAAICVDIRKRGISERPYKYKLYKEIGGAKNMDEKVTLCKYAMHCMGGKKSGLVVPIKIAILRGDEELFKRLQGIVSPDKWTEDISYVIRYGNVQTQSSNTWWPEYARNFSAEDKINSGFLETYKEKLEERLERINRILSGNISDEDKEWMKTIERSAEYSYYQRNEKNIRLNY
ncbi:MAG TPA: hypothetical protein PK122_00235 [Candidatus Paceibacterota bacterium]|nr:hypothetical protein [Candidatus Paceibacterota bacterium]